MGGAAGNPTTNSKTGTYKTGTGLTLPSTVPKGGYGSVETGWTPQQLNNLSNIGPTFNALNPNFSQQIAQSMNPSNPGVSPIYSGPAPATPTPPNTQPPPVTTPPPPAPPPYIPPSGPSGPMSGAAVQGGGIQGASWGPLAGYFSALMGGR